jgi:hypothetical protein
MYNIKMTYYIPLIMFDILANCIHLSSVVANNKTIRQRSLPIIYNTTTYPRLEQSKYDKTRYAFQQHHMLNTYKNGIYFRK